MPFKDRAKQRECDRRWQRNKRAADPEGFRKRRRGQRAALRERALALLGGKCLECGTTAGLEFDHIIPRKKTGDPTISDMLRLKGWDAIEIEVRKCELRCRRCHQIKTDPNAFQHGIPARYSKGCRCHLCKEARQKRWKEKKQ